MAIRIGINGFGRIGKALFRAIYELYPNDFEVIAINAPGDISNHITLLKYDSVHGRFDADIIAGERYFEINDKRIECHDQRNPESLSWNVDLVFECTGNFNNKKDASVHLVTGAKRVIISAPCKDADATIILGANDHVISSDLKVISVGSCTTNCLAPIAQILHQNLGIESGFVTTIHSYTNDQRVLDGSHKDVRRARACGLSMIPTSTGAAHTIGVVIPELDGKLKGSAIRVPTPNVSMIDFTFLSKKNTAKDEINNIISNASKSTHRNIVGFSMEKLVSVDFNHTTQSAILDSFETEVINGNFCRVVAWYDNEWGFVCRMLDVAKRSLNA